MENEVSHNRGGSESSKSEDVGERIDVFVKDIFGRGNERG